MKKETYAKICKKCKVLIRKEDAENKKAWRIKIKVAKNQKPEKVKVNIK